MNQFKTFLQLQKIDVAKREVWGVAAVEQPDRAREIMDYEKSLPNFINWSRDMEKASGGKSKGNLRAMHQDIAAGKLIHFEPRDNTKAFYIGTKIIDDNEWQKVLEGVYTGFSVGGSYGDKWEDPMLKGYTRYEAKPVEISLVDTPCMPGATFEIVKADGAVELMKLRTTDEAGDLEKGDYEGHPFRGNQHTGGKSGGGKYKERQSVSHKGRKATILSTDDESGTAWIYYDDNPDEDAIVKHSEFDNSEGNDYDPKMKHALEFADNETVASAAEILEAQGLSVYTHGNKLRFETPEEQNEAADILGAKGMRGLDGQRADLSEWDSEVKRGISGVSSLSQKERTKKIKELSTKRDSWTGTYLDTVRGERGRYTEMLFSKFGEEEVKRGNYPEKYKLYENDLDAWENILIEARQRKVGKSLGVSELLKEVNMESKDLLEKLSASTDPAMQSLATELSKVFPPAKKKESSEEGTDEAEADDKKSKSNPFSAKEKGNEEIEPDGDEGENPEAESDGDGDESEEAGEQPAGAPSTEQTEAIRAVVIQLLEELGFVQEQGGQPGSPAVVKFVAENDLQKILTGDDGLQKRLNDFTKRQEEITKDVATLYTSLKEMEKRGGPAPVIRDLGALTSTSAGELQKAALLREMIDQTTEPNAKQVLQLQLTEIEIRQAQTKK